jgi:hypothetical protein
MAKLKMSGRDITTLALLFVMTTLLFADQMIMIKGNSYRLKGKISREGSSE